MILVKFVWPLCTNKELESFSHICIWNENCGRQNKSSYIVQDTYKSVRERIRNGMRDLELSKTS